MSRDACVGIGPRVGMGGEGGSSPSHGREAGGLGKG